MPKPLGCREIAKFIRTHAPNKVFKIPSDGPTTALYVTTYTSPDGAYSQGEILLTELPMHRHEMSQAFGMIHGSVKMHVDGQNVPLMFGSGKGLRHVNRNVPHSAVSLIRTPALMTVMSVPPWDPSRFEFVVPD